MVRCRTQRPEPIRALGLRHFIKNRGTLSGQLGTAPLNMKLTRKGIGHRWHECDLGIGDFQVSVDQHDCPASCDLAKDPA